MTDGDLISRKAVIDGINAYIDKAQYSGTIDVFILFEELVVKSLPAVKPLKKEQTDGDLISRQAVLEIFGDIHPLDYNARAYVAQIKELSSAEKTAHWVGIDDFPNEDWECDNCGFIITGIEEPYRFCPNCGAKMKESEEK